MQKTYYVLIPVLIALIGLSGYLWYTLDTTQKTATLQETNLAANINTLQSNLGAAQVRITELEALLTETQALLQDAVDENDDLAHDLRTEKNKNEAFEDQIDKIGSTVGTLDKLSKIDVELLMKYSKVYFLNEHYMPEKVTQIDKELLYSEAEPKFIHAKVAPLLTRMINDALDDGVKLWVVSAFRSFDEQRDLKGAYSVTYGSGANTFSADQGYSEHQLGTTVDLTTEGLGGGLTGFEESPAYAWLQKNAYKYGFVLSYPKGNQYYVFEPWHWRFVGQDLADDLHDSNKAFYDLDQREIDEYLISIFD
jgi:D-alanyl-D-alanine carboxypeptidase